MLVAKIAEVFLSNVFCVLIGQSFTLPECFFDFLKYFKIPYKVIWLNLNAPPAPMDTVTLH